MSNLTDEQRAWNALADEKVEKTFREFDRSWNSYHRGLMLESELDKLLFDALDEGFGRFLLQYGIEFSFNYANYPYFLTHKPLKFAARGAAEGMGRTGNRGDMQASKVIVGIDVGGSTTKIVGFDVSDGKRALIEPLFVRANDPVTAAYGAFGKFLDRNGIALSQIDRVMMTGVGSSFLSRGLYELTCVNVPEFNSIGLGGQFLSELSDCLVVSLGTGTAFVHVKDGSADGKGTPLGMGEAPVADVRAWAKENNVPMVVESETCKPDGITEAKICIEYLRSLEQ
jgi:hypothetical protein